MATANGLGIMLISIIVTTIPFGYGTVLLTSEYSTTHVKITCKVTDLDATHFMIHLYCPFVTDAMCFNNCTAYCTMNINNTCVPLQDLSTTSCSYKVFNTSSVSTSYQIKTSQIQKSGEWSCSFKNYKSTTINLAKYEVPTTTESAVENTVPVPIKHVTEEKRYITYVESQTKTPQSFKKEDQSTKSSTITTQIHFLDYLTRHELVLVLILLLGISLLLNLSFLIRCVLLKSVIENYYRGTPNSQCILECLCLDLVSHKYMHRRYSRNVNLYNQMSTDLYKCQPMCPDNMAIYDDLSAVSNNSARMKMRSNYGSEVDDETQLTNIVPNGGYHINNNSIGIGSVSSSLTRRYANPGHAAYFHPGLGNYVIVSGPVASHDQYSVGTAPSGYTLQMVSPIPSAPGSIGGGGTGAHHSVSSAHSDESDNDSRTALSASMTSAMPGRSVRVNSQPIDLRDSGKANFSMPMNELDHQQMIHYHHHDNNRNYIRSNGSVPLHPWPIETLIPATSSVSSLPYYPVSENGASYNQDLRNKNHNDKLPTPPKDASLNES